MREPTRYEEMDQQFNNLPMPDEETSWQKMKELLDDDDDDNIVPLPVFLKSCLGWGILLLAGLTIAWLIVRPEKWWNETSQTNPSSSNKNEKNITKEHSTNNTTNQINEKNPEQRATSTQPLNPTNNTRVVTGSGQDKVDYPAKSQLTRQKEGDIATYKIAVSNQKTLLKKNAIPKIQKPALTKVQKEVNVNNKEKTATEIKNTDSVSINHPTGKAATEILTEEKEKDKTTDSTINLTIETLIKPDDTGSKANEAQPKDSLNQKKTNSKPKKLLLAAGIGEQQLIPIAGQTTVPYSRYGRKGSLADYVPSVFVQLQKEKKWFAQTEFRYGAAQSVKELSYNQNTKYDAATSKVTVTTMRLKKTYYHQLPVSFNYFLLPNLSVGIGGMYSRFYGAVTEKEITTFNTQTQVVSTIKQIIPVRNFTDSFLYKTQVHALLQADYHWRKFSFGLRYTKDMQPYIKYTKPDGTIDEEKNQSLQFIIRYKLWQGKL